MSGDLETTRNSLERPSPYSGLLLSATIKALNRLDNERPRGPLPRKGDVMTITRDLVESERAGR